jgi:hypothetical protein
MYKSVLGKINKLQKKNHDLHELGDWSKRWLMSFNPDKAEIILLKYVKNSTNFNLYFDGRKEAYHQYH